MQLFPSALCSDQSRANMALPFLCLICFSVLYYFLFFTVPSKPHNVQRVAFHFQPIKNWMNDPNGPMLYKGYYHFFYQWNPYAAVWGNITWGHAVSKDLIRWHHLEVALIPNQWYDLYGCWSGSATLVEEGKPIITYTGWSNASHSEDHKVQMQALAMPADYGDPLLRKWVKAPGNPIITAPQGIDSNFFRDPTTAWKGADGKWRMLVGSKENMTGMALLYRSPDFLNWRKAITPLHSVNGTGMWECPDFYPVSISDTYGLNTSAYGQGVMHVLKVSFVHDYYTVGTYITSNDTFLPVQSNLDVGIGLRYDYGKYYASKSFFDANKNRRILFGWVNESDGEAADISKGWASVQAFPRKVWLDKETNCSLLHWPIEELESLHRSKVTLDSVSLWKGSVTVVEGIKGAQLDVEATFDLPEINDAEIMDVSAENAQLMCSEKGASRNGVIGPFGFLVLATDDEMEHTAIFFVVVNSKDGWKVLVCSDQSRSSLATNLDKTTYGSFSNLSGSQTSVSVRILVDNSIVETFALGGKICITSRVYPKNAVGEAARLFLFNNGTVPIRMNSLIARELAGAKIDGIES
ncbi:hypothetical protein KP509_33G065700 [Ceratopteris richardii]|uniref:Beta-fructofuranosidase n=2 Tax=Ceratopteris richardii TaxID=49495 RepID=A0A8T2QQX7_CERRI|nr:hypothetical protein KP509_33G065700 [Ceratopteris richardii]